MQLMQVVNVRGETIVLHPQHVESIYSNSVRTLIKTSSGVEHALADSEKLDSVISLWKTCLGIQR